MSTALTARRMAGVSPRSRSRTTGVVHLLFFVTASVGELFTERAGVSGLTALPGDATTVAHGILAHEAAYRAGWAVTVISTVLDVAVVALPVLLVRPVSRSLAVVLALFGLVALAVTAFGSLLPLVPLVILGGSSGAFDAKQLQARRLSRLSRRWRMATSR